MISPFTMQHAQVTAAVDEVRAYFVAQSGVRCPLPPPETLHYWISKGKTPAQIYTLMFGSTFHLEAVRPSGATKNTKDEAVRSASPR